MASKAQQTVTVEFKAKGDDVLIATIKKLNEATKALTKTQNSITKAETKKTVSSKSHRKAVEKLRVALQLEGKSLKDLKVPLSEYKRALRGNDLALARLRKTTKKYVRDLKGFSHRTRILGGTLAVLRSKLLLFNFAVGFAIRAVGKFATTASKVENMERAFGTLSGSTDDSRVALEKLQQATNGTMSEFDLFQQANNAMILGVSTNSDEMAEMFDIAQRLGRALGRDTASSVESLVTGIGRQSRLMLDNIGIIVKSEEAYEAYAKKLGISVDQLTDQEKKTAFLESAMESARAKVETLGDEVVTNQDVYDQLSRATSELAVATGEVLQPALTTTAKAFTSVFESATKYLDSIALADKPIKESMSNEQKLLILVARRTKLAGELAEMQNDVFGLEESEKEIKLKKRIARIGEHINNINLGQKDSIIKIAEAIQQETEAFQKNNSVIDLRSQIFQKEIDIIKQRNLDLKNGLTITEQLNAIDEKRALIKLQERNKDITAQEAIKKNLELDTEQINLKEKLTTATVKGATDALSAMSELAGHNKKTAELAKGLAIASATIDMFAGMNKAFAQEGILGFLSATAIFAQGMANIQQIKAQKFERGGMVGGNRHSQGGTMIEAERGEFVMSRSAVQSIGSETLAQMNQTGNSGVTVNISAPLVDETVVETIIPAIQKAQRMNLA